MPLRHMIERLLSRVLDPLLGPAARAAEGICDRDMDLVTQGARPPSRLAIAANATAPPSRAQGS